MKKRILLIAAVFASTMAIGQDLTSKKGETMLPEEGDYALGFDAAPFLNYVGNFLGNVGNTAPTANWATNDLSIMGKMYKDAQTAYRGRVRLGFGSTSATTLTDTASGFTPAYIEDETKNSYNAITLGGGIEKRRGNTRIQGFYGGEATIMIGGAKTTNEYGLAVSDSNPGDRITESKTSTFGLGINGLAGVEIFVFPKVSLGFEYRWGLNFASTGEGEESHEVYDFANSSVATYTAKTGKSSSFGVDTGNNGGAIVAIFHF